MFAFFTGRLGHDVEAKSITTKKGQQMVANMSIAEDKSYRDAAGNKVKRTEWHKVVCWDKLAVSMAKHCKKGKTLTIVGESNPVEYTNKAGQLVKDIEIKPIKIIFGADARNNAYDEPEHKVAHATPAPAAAPVAAAPAQPAAPAVPAPPGFAWSYMNSMYVLIPITPTAPAAAQPGMVVVEPDMVVIAGV
jgi:single-strand DNA-binding protein